MYKVRNFINGEETSASDDFLNIHNPSTGEIQGEVVDSNLLDFNNTIDSSLNAFELWSKVTPLKRSRIISNYKKLLEDNINELAEIICKEHGKTFDDAIGSITRGIAVVEFACGIPHLLPGECAE